MDTKTTGPATRDDIKRFKENYQGEIDGIAIYRRLAAAEKDPERSRIFLDLAETEKRHLERLGGAPARCRRRPWQAAAELPRAHARVSRRPFRRPRRAADGERDGVDRLRRLHGAEGRRPGDGPQRARPRPHTRDDVLARRRDRYRRHRARRKLAPRRYRRPAACGDLRHQRWTALEPEPRNRRRWCEPRRPLHRARRRRRAARRRLLDGRGRVDLRHVAA